MDGYAKIKNMFSTRSYSYSTHMVANNSFSQCFSISSICLPNTGGCLPKAGVVMKFLRSENGFKTLFECFGGENIITGKIISLANDVRIAVGISP